MAAKASFRGTPLKDLTRTPEMRTKVARRLMTFATVSTATLPTTSDLFARSPKVLKRFVLLKRTLPA